jgi:hypothetical protein
MRVTLIPARRFQRRAFFFAPDDAVWQRTNRTTVRPFGSI